MSAVDLNSALSPRAEREKAIREQHVAALKREREQMVALGREDRVALIDEELDEFEPSSEPVDRSTPPKGRRSASKSTAKAGGASTVADEAGD